MNRDPLRLGLSGYDLRWSTETDGWVLPEPFVNPWGLVELLTRKSLDAHTINLLYHRRAWLTQNGLLVEGDRPREESVTGAEGIRQLALSEGIAIDKALLFALPKPVFDQTRGPRSTMQLRADLAPLIKRAERFAKIGAPAPIVAQLMTRIQDIVSDAMTYAVARDAWHISGITLDDRLRVWFTKHERPGYGILQSSAERPGRAEIWANRAHATRKSLQDAARRVQGNPEKQADLAHVLRALGLRGTNP